MVDREGYARRTSAHHAKWTLIGDRFSYPACPLFRRRNACSTRRTASSTALKPVTTLRATKKKNSAPRNLGTGAAKAASRAVPRSAGVAPCSPLPTRRTKRRQMMQSSALQGTWLSYCCLSKHRRQYGNIFCWNAEHQLYDTK